MPREESGKQKEPRGLTEVTPLRESPSPFLACGKPVSLMGLPWHPGYVAAGLSSGSCVGDTRAGSGLSLRVLRARHDSWHLVNVGWVSFSFSPPSLSFFFNASFFLRLNFFKLSVHPTWGSTHSPEIKSHLLHGASWAPLNVSFWSSRCPLTDEEGGLGQCTGVTWEPLQTRRDPSQTC